MSDKPAVVFIQLDRPRMLRYGHKALKTLTALTGKDLDASMSMENLDLGELEKILYCGLLSDAVAHNEVLKLEDMEDLLDQAPSFSHIVEKMQEAFGSSFGDLAAKN
jgi:hypothetical protein